MTKKKLSNSILQFKEKCVCGTEIEFESSTGMVFDKMMQRWDKAHAAHVEDAAHPPVAVGMDPGAIFSDEMLKAAVEVEKTMLGVVPVTGVKPATTQAAKKTKKPSVVEIEEANQKAWAAKSEFEQTRINILQALSQNMISQNEARHQLEEVNTREHWKQEQSERDKRTATSEGDAASSRV